MKKQPRETINYLHPQGMKCLSSELSAKWLEETKKSALFWTGIFTWCPPTGPFNLKHSVTCSLLHTLPDKLEQFWGKSTEEWPVHPPNTTEIPKNGEKIQFISTQKTALPYNLLLFSYRNCIKYFWESKDVRCECGGQGKRKDVLFDCKSFLNTAFMPFSIVM